MAIHYHCRHCGKHVGSLEHQNLTSEQLGFHELTSEERQAMLEYDKQGHLQVKTICEDCHEALERNPDYYALHSFIQ
ncbi:anti-sigma-F factor Fin family protein [Fictibacillus sp. WQ 8-8]|uniref:anti-sigma-F factor Fin family protein n=1 Tax=unclassified Fictibacillus TaxID=2644029 RepID=UPI0006A79994|nr:MULTISPECIES: anti-sigma-F factor Fin family protein [unclassified Fictibacillus]MCQ6268506.1 anti-sigma-F factor Fin family protein [Fictibacillus sp. WQ 8-8]MED2971592.1 anti-sigma-F factor Fin family protein [Fictibacillus sp. B-59209]UZJ78948.1 anti-sigma-F factor Fin family protein [Fictibacillus sp. KU28468]SFF14237.1 Protein of unknown function [Bacillus sp. OV194]